MVHTRSMTRQRLNEEKIKTISQPVPDVYSVKMGENQVGENQMGENQMGGNQDKKEVKNFIERVSFGLKCAETTTDYNNQIVCIFKIYDFILENIHILQRDTFVPLKIVVIKKIQELTYEMAKKMIQYNREATEQETRLLQLFAHPVFVKMIYQANN